VSDALRRFQLNSSAPDAVRPFVFTTHTILLLFITYPSSPFLILSYDGYGRLDPRAGFIERGDAGN
jgi:hypothetical protein